MIFAQSTKMFSPANCQLLFAKLALCNLRQFDGCVRNTNAGMYPVQMNVVVSMQYSIS
jgi:hypothetical protein